MVLKEMDIEILDLPKRINFPTILAQKIKYHLYIFQSLFHTDFNNPCKECQKIFSLCQFHKFSYHNWMRLVPNKPFEFHVYH